MSQAAFQTNTAVREPAQALEQITARLSALAGRLLRLEQRAAQDGLREAVKALHQGLSCLADQIAETARDSASQINSLTGNLDSFAGRLAQAQDNAEATTQALDEDIASLDERIRAVERMAFSSASALDRTMENLEQLRTAQESAHADPQDGAAGMTQLKDACDCLSARFDASEIQGAAIVARLENRLSKLETRQPDDSMDRRLQNIEGILSTLIGRIEHTEAISNTVANIEEKLSHVSAALEGADTHNQEAVQQLQAAVHETSGRLATIESKLSPADVKKPAEPILDMPPFSEPSPTESSAFSPPPPFPFDAEEPTPVEQLETAWGESLSELPSTEPPETYVAAARRAAHAAAVESEMAAPAPMGGFGWTFTGNGEESRQRKGAGRYVMAGSIFGVAVAAALTGVVLTRGAGAPPAQAPTSFITGPVAPAHGFAQTKPASGAMRGASDDTASAAGISGSPSLSSVPHSAPRNSAPGASEADPAPVPAAANERELPAPPPAERTAAPSTSASSTSGESGLQKLAALAGTGDSKAQLLLGLQYLGNGGATANEAEAARWLARAAQQGEPFAQYRLATLYERGRGVAADPRQAAHWYELAAKQGNRKAMHNLAIAFAEGTGEPKNPEQAAMWFNRAASLGLADSQFNLAVLYERGMGVQQSLVEAYKWYLIAAAQGDAESKTRAEALATQLSDSDRNAAQQAAATFKPQDPNPAANLAPTLG